MHKYDKDDKSELITNEIRRIAQKFGKTPTQNEYKRETNLKNSTGQIKYFFGSLTKACESAGLIPNPIQQPPKKAKICSRSFV
ncbi:MAG: hypothetical protein NT145_08970 [Elusimicrobia bacterium]|nr:hypothetical protein [Elusimicrobiota bacterium]